MSKQAVLTFEEVRWRLAGLEANCPCLIAPATLCCEVCLQYGAITHGHSPGGLCNPCNGTGKVKRLPMLSLPCPGEHSFTAGDFDCVAGHLTRMTERGMRSLQGAHDTCRGTGYISTPPDLSLYLDALETLYGKNLSSILIVKGDGFYVVQINLWTKPQDWDVPHYEWTGVTREEAAAGLLLKVAKASK